ncbi:hypothetical protein RND71_023025 [Anisodus tanguticus]|uniref:Uncharacterized protein n=1 Tax=Anisodus tanguticus TaxID=243964 RepID=A0AAE1VED8_9SOLA|nr:hypothetical protein RND71_023025 [Anisodus tanguticus]
MTEEQLKIVVDENDEHDSKKIVLQRYFFREWKLVILFPMALSPTSHLHIKFDLSEDMHVNRPLTDPSSTALKATISPTKAAEASDAGVAVEVPTEIISEDVLLRYFGSVDTSSPPALPVGIHGDRVEEFLARGIPTKKEELYALRASLLRLSKETTDSPVLATTYNDMALALNDLIALHRTAKDSHDEVVAALQHLGSLPQEKNRIQTSFNQNDLQEQLSKLRVELERIQAEIGAIILAIDVLDSAIGTHDSCRSSLFWQSLQLDNKIRELDNQQTVWEMDQSAGSEWLSKLEIEWNKWKIRVVQAMPKITTLLLAHHVGELSADTLMDLQSKAIIASVVQEVSDDTQAFTETMKYL